MLPPVYTPAGADREPLTGSADGPLVAEVVKTTTDPYVGRISIVRVFSGTLLPDVPVHVSAGISPGSPVIRRTRPGTPSTIWTNAPAPSPDRSAPL